ncbi:hypothetical protein J1614_001452 [Plenodomus biglobosus]|nr:hypothetical protein J1614_001452 [Plenodomus biglobosus]
MSGNVQSAIKFRRRTASTAGRRKDEATPPTVANYMLGIQSFGHSIQPTQCEQCPLGQRDIQKEEIEGLLDEGDNSQRGHTDPEVLSHADQTSSGEKLGQREIGVTGTGFQSSRQLPHDTEKPSQRETSQAYPLYIPSHTWRRHNSCFYVRP